MDFDRNHWKSALPWRGMSEGWDNGPTPESALSQIQEVKKMMENYRHLLNDEFWTQVRGFHRNKTPVLPIEIWESEQHLYLSAAAPGLKRINHADISFEDDRTLRLKLKSHSMKPPGAAALLRTELPAEAYEREIQLPRAVDATNYTTSYEGGVLCFTFLKKKEKRSKGGQRKPVVVPLDF
ncbi:Hsp20 family protein [Paenibacillus sp. TRM 82003]|nr:Hsp20 family protein [Paenibacillus sp. TRM 82003]